MPPPFCLVCFESGPEGTCKWCEGCRSAWYCSRECQAENWPQHKVVCTKRVRRLLLVELTNLPKAVASRVVAFAGAE